MSSRIEENEMVGEVYVVGGLLVEQFALVDLEAVEALTGDNALLVEVTENSGDDISVEDEKLPASPPLF